MHPWVGERVKAALAAWRDGAAQGETIRLVESVRPLAVQQTYYRQGRSRADGLLSFSLHQFAPALAADAAVLRAGRYVGSAADPAWERWASCAEAEGLESGKRWVGLVDCPHVQAPEAVRVRLVQAAVGATPDGAWGPATEAAIVKAGAELRPGRGWARMTPAAWWALLR